MKRVIQSGDVRHFASLVIWVTSAISEMTVESFRRIDRYLLSAGLLLSEDIGKLRGEVKRREFLG